MDQTKNIIPNKHKESAEERRVRLDKNNEKARAKSRTETEQNKTLGRALDPRANGTWLSKLTE